MENTIKILLIAALFSLQACGDDSSSQTPGFTAGPEQVIEQFTTVDRSGGKKNWELHAQKARLYEEKGIADLVSPELFFYEAGVESSRVSAKQGFINQSKKTVDVWGDVVIHSLKDNTFIRTQKAHYDIELKKVNSDSEVEIEKPSMKTTGVGFESDIGLNMIRVKHRRTELHNEKK
jgi:LPS export ABC transporter protein LptC